MKHPVRPFEGDGKTVNNDDDDDEVMANMFRDQFSSVLSIPKRIGKVDDS